MVVVEGVVVVQMDREVIEGGDGAGGERWRKRRRGKGGGREVGNTVAMWMWGESADVCRTDGVGVWYGTICVL